MGIVVQLRKFISSGHNGIVFGDPIDLPVAGWWPVKSFENPTSGTLSAVVRRNLIVRKLPQPINSKDIIEWDGDTWQITGDISDWNQGPFRYRPGWIITVEK